MFNPDSVQFCLYSPWSFVPRLKITASFVSPVMVLVGLSNGKLFSVETTEPKELTYAHSCSVIHIDVSGDHHIVSVDLNGHVLIQHPHERVRTPSSVLCASFESHVLLTGESTGHIRLWTKPFGRRRRPTVLVSEESSAVATLTWRNDIAAWLCQDGSIGVSRCVAKGTASAGPICRIKGTEGVTSASKDEALTNVYGQHTLMNPYRLRLQWMSTHEHLLLVLSGKGDRLRVVSIDSEEKDPQLLTLHDLCISQMAQEVSLRLLAAVPMRWWGEHRRLACLLAELGNDGWIEMPGGCCMAVLSLSTNSRLEFREQFAPETETLKIRISADEAHLFPMAKTDIGGEWKCVALSLPDQTRLLACRATNDDRMDYLLESGQTERAFVLASSVQGLERHSLQVVGHCLLEELFKSSRYVSIAQYLPQILQSEDQTRWTEWEERLHQISRAHHLAGVIPLTSDNIQRDVFTCILLDYFTDDGEPQESENIPQLSLPTALRRLVGRFDSATLVDALKTASYNVMELVETAALLHAGEGRVDLGLQLLVACTDEEAPHPAVIPFIREHSCYKEAEIVLPRLLQLEDQHQVLNLLLSRVESDGSDEWALSPRRVCHVLAQDAHLGMLWKLVKALSHLAENPKEEPRVLAARSALQVLMEEEPMRVLTLQLQKNPAGLTSLLEMVGSSLPLKEAQALLLEHGEVEAAVRVMEQRGYRTECIQVLFQETQNPKRCLRFIESSIGNSPSTMMEMLDTLTQMIVQTDTEARKERETLREIQSSHPIVQYMVHRPSETWESIALLHDVSLDLLREVNPHLNFVDAETILTRGTKVRIPVQLIETFLKSLVNLMRGNFNDTFSLSSKQLRNPSDDFSWIQPLRILKQFPESLPLAEVSDSVEELLNVYRQQLQFQTAMFETIQLEARELEQQIKLTRLQPLLLTPVSSFCDVCHEPLQAVSKKQALNVSLEDLCDSLGIFAFGCGHLVHERCLTSQLRSTDVSDVTTENSELPFQCPVPPCATVETEES